MSKKYVLIYCERTGFNSDSSEILLVQKNRPEIQNGFYNLPGGAIENNESPSQAAERELFEETGYRINNDLALVGTVKDVGDNYGIYVFKADIKSPFSEISPRPSETESVEWKSISKILKSDRLIPNLRVIIPIIRGGGTDWVIEAKLLHSYGPNHNLSIWFPTYIKSEEN
jgi:8-oxo-dGTP pyrophosphatase MutT (NUDIX family)